MPKLFNFCVYYNTICFTTEANPACRIVVDRTFPVLVRRNLVQTRFPIQVLVGHSHTSVLSVKAGGVNFLVGLTLPTEPPVQVASIPVYLPYSSTNVIHIQHPG